MQPKNRIVIVTAVIVLLLVAGVMNALAANAASTPTSSGGVTPYIIDGANSGGNRTCAEVGLAFFGDPNYYQFSSARVNYDGDTDTFDVPFPGGVSVSVTNDTFVSWTSSFGIGAVIVKGGNSANVYVYEPQRTNDAGLAAPPNASGKPAGLSNITFCWNPEPAEPQWCSPGYWRQPHHLESWAATNYSPNDKYNAIFDPDLPGDPTLLYVLQNPQKFQKLGGDPFNRIGELLSEAHPDVNFTGERVEDSCPLN